MKISNCLVASLPAVVLLPLSGSAEAAERSPLTYSITMSDMNCPSCAKKIAAKLSEIVGVAKVATDIETQTAKVILKPNVILSPKVLWDAVEKAKKTPTRIEGPNGILSAKPKQ